MFFSCVCLYVCVCLSGWLDHIPVKRECYLSHMFDEQIELRAGCRKCPTQILSFTDKQTQYTVHPTVLYAQSLIFILSASGTSWQS